MFKTGDIIKSKYGVMHVIAYVDKNYIYFLDRNIVYKVENNRNDWEIVDKTLLLGLEAE